MDQVIMARSPGGASLDKTLVVDKEDKLEFSVSLTGRRWLYKQELCEEIDIIIIVFFKCTKIILITKNARFFHTIKDNKI